MLRSYDTILVAYCFWTTSVGRSHCGVDASLVLV